MLSVSGLIAILDEPQERVVKEATYFSFLAVTKDSYSPPRTHFYRASVTAYREDALEARKELKKGKVLLIRHGEWSALENKNHPGTYSNYLQLSWKQIKVLGWFSNRKEE